MRFRWQFLFVSLPCLVSSAGLHAQQGVTYATVYTNRLFIVGAGNPRTGLFRKGAPDLVWEHLGPPNIRAFGFDDVRASRGRILYIAAGNGLHRSGDGGKNWKIVTDWRVTEVLSVAADQTDSLRVYISTPYGIWSTADGCRSWKKIVSGLHSSFTSRVIVDVRDPRRLYCSTESGVYVSTDRGERWRRSALPFRGIRTIVQHPVDAKYLAAGTEEDGIILSTDRGESWRPAAGAPAHATIYAASFDPRDPRILYCGGFGTGVYRTTDGGKSWRRGGEGLDEPTIHAIAVESGTPARIHAATLGRGVYTSTDGGVHWFSAGLDSTKIWSMQWSGE